MEMEKYGLLTNEEIDEISLGGIEEEPVSEASAAQFAASAAAGAAALLVMHPSIHRNRGAVLRVKAGGGTI